MRTLAGRAALATVATVTSLTLVALGLVFFFRSAGVALPPTADGPYTLAFLISAMTFVAVGAALVALRPANRIGWVFCLVSLLGGFIFFAQRFGAYAILVDPAQFGTAGELVLWLGTPLTVINTGLIVGYVPLHFPDGRLPSAHWRPVLWSLRLSLVVLAIGFSFSAVDLFTMTTYPNPFHVGNPILREISNAGLALAIVSLLAAAASLIWRYRAGDRQLRQQIKWFAYSGGLQAALLLSILLTGAAREPAALVIMSFAFATLPVATAIAVLRYQLYDIDLLIKRTLVYGATTAAIAATFLLGILALTQLMRPLTSGSELAVAASTLASFALFQPIRRRVQDAVDRRFDRSRYDASRTLDAFADQLRDEVDLDTLRADFLGAVRQTMAPAHASLWLRKRPLRGDLGAERS
ncbi:MAG: hypothetical protein M3T56_18255 [Chloroflexota bacterium]|nr:hypothetical protein [Chloroflexota bacterium]